MELGACFTIRDEKGRIDRIMAAIHILSTCFIAGLLVIVIFALNSGSPSGFVSVAGAGVLLATGIFFLGVFIGFLFGIPRTLQGSSQKQGEGKESIGEQRNLAGNEQYGPNTNLEQMSDWLTKILVGVGLTQLTQVPSALQTFSENVAPSLGGSPSSGLLAVGILIFFSIDGFLIGYLWTRRYFTLELDIGDKERKELQQQVAEIKQQKAEADTQIAEMEEKKREHERQANADQLALEATNRVLVPAPGTPALSQAELDMKIAPASPDIKRTIYYKAATLTYSGDKDEPTRPQTLEGAEKIFRALIASDTEKKYENNHSLLGYILHEKKAWREALDAFTAAISIRGSWKDHDKVWFEFYQALCLIHLDEAYNRDQPSPEAVKKSILDALEVASKQEDLKAAMDKDETIEKWYRLNGINLK